MTETDQPPPSPQPARRNRAVVIGMAIGTLFTVLLVVAAVYWFHPYLRTWLLADQQEQLDQIEIRLTDLTDRVDHLAAERATPAVPTAEAAPADIDSRIAKLDANIAELRRAIPPEGVILRLTERTEAAEKTVRDIERKQASAQALLLIVGQLKDAVDRGDAFADELKAAQSQLDDSERALLTGFAAGAENGIPRREQLLRDFQPLTEALLQQEEESKGPGFWRAIARQIHRLVTVRRMDGKGNDAEAVLARAEAALKKDDWDQALSEMHALPGPFETTAAPWITQAESRLAADRALSKLTAEAVAKTAPR